MSIQLNDGLACQSVDLVLEDLLVRFLVNVPDEDLSSIERVFFQVEEAQWFYTDFVRQMSPSLPSMKMKSFAAKLLEKCPLIWKWGDPMDAIARFGKYKSTIPVRGIALFNKDLTKVVLVKGTESSSWSFPRGKISKDESDIDCAIREVEEETGFNARKLLNEKDVIERTIKGKNYKIYLVKNVPEDFNFRPLGRHEIALVKWFDIKTLQKKTRVNPNQFFIVTPVMKPMLSWINKNKGLFNEEELMLQAEIKLKKLLNINQQQNVNVDAGRELLNILQGIGPQSAEMAPSSQAGQAPIEQYIQMALPQHLEKQFPVGGMQNNLQPFAIPGQPFLVPQFPPHAFASIDVSRQIPPPNFAPNQMPYPEGSDHPYQAGSQVADPRTFQKPLLANSGSTTKPETSKEFLSILNMKPSERVDTRDTPDGAFNAHSKASNQSKAQHLLDLFKKQTLDSTGVQDINSQPPSNTSKGFDSSKKENGSYQNDNSKTPEVFSNSSSSSPATAKKLTLLKRPRELNANERLNNHSAELLRMLGKPPISSNDANVQAQTPLVEDKELTIEKSSSGRTSKNRVAANELLGLLNKKKESSPLVQDSRSSQNAQNAVADSLANSKEKSGNATDLEEFEEFEDFEDLEQASNHAPTILRANDAPTFDVASDDEEPKVKHLPPHDGEAQERAPKKNKIRLLKPGQSINDLITEQDQNMNIEKKDFGESNVPLDISSGERTGGKTPEAHFKEDTPASYASIYLKSDDNQDSFSPFLPQTQTKNTGGAGIGISLNSQQRESPNSQKASTRSLASANLLSLLGKKPSDSSIKLPQQVHPSNSDELESQGGTPEIDTPPPRQNTHEKSPNNGHQGKESSAQSLLSLLKGGFRS